MLLSICGSLDTNCQYMQEAWSGAERLTWKSKQRVWLGGHTDAEKRALGLFVDLRFPIVNLVLFRDRQIAHDGTLRVEELDLSPGLDKTICDLELRLELPSRHALLLDGEVL